MCTLILVLTLGLALLFPTLMITFTYPFSTKLAVFWSNYVTKRCSLRLFAIFKTYKNFRFIGDYESKKMLPEQYLVISNHQSLIDVPVYLKFMNEKEMKFVAKDGLANVPMVGPMLKCQGHCMIPRKGATQVAMRKLENFGKNVMKNKNAIPLIFPEGTRTKDGELGRFSSGGFRRISQTVNLPVAVCALDGGWIIGRLNGGFFKNLKNGAYRVKVLKVYDAPKTKEEEMHILEEGKELIEKQVKAWRALPADSIEI